MGIGFTLIGLVLIITGARDTYAAFGNQLRADFTGPGNFTFWIASIALVGALGYVPQLRTFSHYFMALILLALLLSHQGFFSKLSAALATGPVTPSPPTNGTATGPTLPTPLGTGNSLSSGANAVESIAGGGEQKTTIFGTEYNVGPIFRSILDWNPFK